MTTTEQAPQRDAGATPKQFHLMTMSEVSELTRVPVTTLRWYRHNGQGPHAGKVGGRVMYRREDVEAWLDAAFEGGVSA